MKKVIFEKKERSRKNRKGNRKAVNPSTGVLRQLTDQLHTRFTFRFCTTPVFTGAFSVTYGNLLDVWFVATTATTGKQLFDFIRIRQVRVMACASPSTVVGASPVTTVGIEFFGLNNGQIGSGRQATQTKLGMNGASCVALGPDPGSQAAQWQPSSTVTAFAVRAIDYNTAPLAGVIIEVDVDLKNSADVLPTAINSAPSGATAGELYFGGLDGLRLASTQAYCVFQPRL